LYDPDMAETLVLFRGDAAGEKATDFLNSIKHRGLTTPGFDNNKKIEYLQLSLKSGQYIWSG
jgi:arginine/lysine/ornithine decarboxylase